MIVDFHTHIFPPAMIERRDELVRADATFAEMYGDPKAKMADAPDLLRSMDESGVDVSVVLGFAWSSREDCRSHSDYILEAAHASGGRLVPFGTVMLSDAGAVAEDVPRLVARGARGLGELRPQSQGAAIADGPAGEALAAEPRLILSFHASEPVGHSYPGKEGADIRDLYGFAARAPDATIVLAHWGGGLPFFTLMPEVEAALNNVYFDTAASRFLYSPRVYRTVAGLVGGARILFGSDFPLVSQKSAIEDVRKSGLSAEEVEMVLGGNAARLLGLE